MGRGRSIICEFFLLEEVRTKKGDGKADCAVVSPYDVAGGWEVLMTWHEVYLERVTGRASGKSVHWRCSYTKIDLNLM